MQGQPLKAGSRGKKDAPIGGVCRDGSCLWSRRDLDERGNEPPDAVQCGAERVAGATMGCRERLGRVSVENTIHLGKVSTASTTLCYKSCDLQHS